MFTIVRLHLHVINSFIKVQYQLDGGICGDLLFIKVLSKTKNKKDQYLIQNIISHRLYLYNIRYYNIVGH